MFSSEFLGSIAALFSIILLVVGFPHQIWKNYSRKSFEGLSPALVISAFFTYLLWGGYAWVKPDSFLKISQTPGFFLCFILIIQLIRYKPLSPKKQKMYEELQMLQNRNNEVGANEWRDAKILFLKKKLKLV